MDIETYLSQQPTPAIAQDLLGRQLRLVTPAGMMTAWITETEAYLGAQDAGAHAFKNHQTARNQALWQSAGTIYIYQMRTQFLLNFVTQAAGVPECVLIRGIEPATGLPLMQANRPQPLKNLTNGPGKLMQALGLDKQLNGQPLNVGPLHLQLTPRRVPIKISTSGRVGIVNKGDWSSAPLRYYVTGNPWVSQSRQRDIDPETHGWQAL
ncbi:DNA-3-methyladenine glycosylase [Lactiplantibacillus fabifermentans]|uniref:Putative 3-methyladenine DNA glycosylase n=2 Tax=Lactiplantibacillus fabifermentans TaxID=483011 RepID=A0A0R2NR55_9LACO|nr:DNA-3-methyladenine glycosylase [Lactiplantibacillus fabifermentans]ETY74164.1 3-methyladenine DNA glycosylase [Lactiplantibacillus fabifermentans T30PCM01]KRO28148.1 3-methyladenine dna glycosylase [Lactiplantibacillus fabifermentans DSM 21115]